jgi:hypothetical protein
MLENQAKSMQRAIGRKDGLGFKIILLSNGKTPTLLLCAYWLFNLNGRCKVRGKVYTQSSDCRSEDG